MKQRSITAFVFAIVMIGGMYWSQYSFQVLFTLMALGMLWEFFGLMFPKDDPQRMFRRVLGCVIGFLPVWWIGMGIMSAAVCGNSTPDELLKVNWQSQLENAGLMFVYTAFMVLLAFIIELFRQGKSPASTIGHYLLGLFYIGLPILFLFSLVMPAGVFTPDRAFGLLWLIWTNDTFAYLVGSRWGKSKLYERISPKKTWEGAIGGAAGAVLMAWALAQYFPAYNLAQWLTLAMLAAVVGTIGDLVESMLKRNAGVKDSGNLLPGHGGLLDRFDSFIFVLPFAWLAVILLGE